MSDKFYIQRSTPDDYGCMASIYIPPNTTPVPLHPPPEPVPGAMHHEPDKSFDYSKAVREHAEREARRFYVFSHGGGARAPVHSHAPFDPTSATGLVVNPPAPAVPPGGLFTSTHATHPTVVQMAGGVPLPTAHSFGSARVQPAPPLARLLSQPVVVEHHDNASTTSASAFGRPLPVEVLLPARLEAPAPAPAAETAAEKVPEPKPEPKPEPTALAPPPPPPPPSAAAPPALPIEDSPVEMAEPPTLLCDEALPTVPAAAELEPAPKPMRVRKAVEFQSNSVDRPKRSCAGKGVQRFGF